MCCPCSLQFLAVAVAALLLSGAAAFNPYAVREAGVRQQRDAVRAHELIRAQIESAKRDFADVFGSEGGASRRLQNGPGGDVDHQHCEDNDSAGCCPALQAFQEHASTAASCSDVMQYVAAVFDPRMQTPTPAELESALPGICAGTCVGDLQDLIAPAAEISEGKGCYEAKMMHSIANMVCSNKGGNWCLAEFVEIMGTEGPGGDDGPTQSQLDAVCGNPCLPEVYTFATSFGDDGSGGDNPNNPGNDDEQCSTYFTTVQAKMEVLSGTDAESINENSMIILQYIGEQFDDGSGDDDEHQEECDEEHVSAELKFEVTGVGFEDLDAKKWDVFNNIAAHFEDGGDDCGPESDVEITFSVDGVSRETVDANAGQIMDNLREEFGGDGGDGGDECHSGHGDLLIDVEIEGSDADSVEANKDAIWHAINENFDDSGGGDDDCHRVDLKITSEVVGIDVGTINQAAYPISERLTANFGDDDGEDGEHCHESPVSIIVPVVGVSEEEINEWHEEIGRNLEQAFGDRDGEGGDEGHDGGNHDDGRNDGHDGDEGGPRVHAKVDDDGNLFVVVDIKMCPREIHDMVEMLNTEESHYLFAQAVNDATEGDAEVAGEIHIMRLDLPHVYGFMADDERVLLVVELEVCADEAGEIELFMMSDEARALLIQSVHEATQVSIEVESIDVHVNDDGGDGGAQHRRLDDHQPHAEISATDVDGGVTVVHIRVLNVCADELEFLKPFLESEDARGLFTDGFRRGLDNPHVIVHDVDVSMEGHGRQLDGHGHEEGPMLTTESHDDGTWYVKIVTRMCEGEAERLRDEIFDDASRAARAIARAVGVDDDDVSVYDVSVTIMTSHHGDEPRRLQGSGFNVIVRMEEGVVVYVVQIPEICPRDIEFIAGLYDSEWGRGILIDSIASALGVDGSTIGVYDIEVYAVTGGTRRLATRLLQEGPMPNLYAYYEDDGTLFLVIEIPHFCQAEIEFLQYFFNEDAIEVFEDAVKYGTGDDVEIGDVTITEIGDDRRMQDGPGGPGGDDYQPSIDLLCSKDADGNYCLLQGDMFEGTDDTDGPPSMDIVCSGCGRAFLQDMADNMREHAPREVAMIEGLMRFGCGSNANGDRCGDLMSSFFTDDDDHHDDSFGHDDDDGHTRLRGRRMDAQAVAAAFQEVQNSCGDPNDASWGPECPAGCADALESMQAAAGCCFYGTFDMQMAVAAEFGGDDDEEEVWDVEELFTKVETACGVTFERICTSGQPVQRSMQINGIRYSYMEANPSTQDAVETAWVAMMADKFGTSTSTFNVLAMRDAPGEGIIIDYEIHAQSDDEMDALVAGIAAAEADSLFDMSGIDSVVPNTEDARYDTSSGLSAQPAEGEVVEPGAASATSMSAVAVALAAVAAAVMA